MAIYLVLQGVLMGLVVAVPVGPLGLLCINRALMLGPVCGLLSGLGVATADALAAGIAALGISLVSAFLVDYQVALRFVGGIFLCYLGSMIYKTEPLKPIAIGKYQWSVRRLHDDIFSHLLKSGDDPFFRGDLRWLARAHFAGPLYCRGPIDPRCVYRFRALVGRDVYRFNNLS